MRPAIYIKNITPTGQTVVFIQCLYLDITHITNAKETYTSVSS